MRLSLSLLPWLAYPSHALTNHIPAIRGEYLRGIMAAFLRRAFGKKGLEPFLELDVPEAPFDGGERCVVVIPEGSGHKRRIGIEHVLHPKR